MHSIVAASPGSGSQVGKKTHTNAVSTDWREETLDEAEAVESAGCVSSSVAGEPTLLTRDQTSVRGNSRAKVLTRRCVLSADWIST